MGQRELTTAERDFADTLAELLTSFQEIHEKAQAVLATGGDCREAFLSVLPEESRADAEIQWPYISLMLGV